MNFICRVGARYTNKERTATYAVLIAGRYRRCRNLKEAEKFWREEWGSGMGASARFKRKYAVHMLCGSCTMFWGTLSNLISELPHSATRSVSDRRMELMRLALHDGTRLVGVRLPAALADPTMLEARLSQTTGPYERKEVKNYVFYIMS